MVLALGLFSLCDELDLICGLGIWHMLDDLVDRLDLGLEHTPVFLAKLTNKKKIFLFENIKTQKLGFQAK